MSIYINGVLVPVAPAAHEDTHVSGGSDDIDSALVLAGIPNHMPKSKLAFTLDKLLKGAGAGVDPTEIDVPSGLSASHGIYIGNDSVNRAIAHGLGAIPEIVFIFSWTGAYFHRIQGGLAQLLYVNPSASGAYAVTAPDATNFYVGNSAQYDQSANQNAYQYNWVAIG